MNERVRTDRRADGISGDMRPLELYRPRACAWPESLRPLGPEKEPFLAWRSRNRDILGGLPDDLCEQWIYRQWPPPFDFLPLDTLSWDRESWSGDRLLASVRSTGGDELDPEFDYAVYQRTGGGDRHPTAIALDTGTWDYPMVLLATPYGVVDEGEFLNDVRYVIVEGRQRFRYLNALHARGRPPAGPHEVIILKTPLTSVS